MQANVYSLGLCLRRISNFDLLIDIFLVSQLIWLLNWKLVWTENKESWSKEFIQVDAASDSSLNDTNEDGVNDVDDINDEDD